MPDPARLLRTLKQAIQAFKNTPGRRGLMIYPDRADEMMVVGDLHGSVENFRLVLKRAELASHAGRHLVLQELIHGPFRYPGGGDRSHQLVDLVAALKCQYPDRVHLILANHELSQCKFQDIAKTEGDLNALFREGVAAAYGAEARSIYAAYLELFVALPVGLKTSNRVFVSHSLPSAARLTGFELAILERDSHDENEFRPGGAVHALLWGRDTSPTNVKAFLHRVDADWLITGHIPCSEGFLHPNDKQVILDAQGTPACYSLCSVRRPLSHSDLIGSVATL
jgi:hypothetical protein